MRMRRRKLCRPCENKSVFCTARRISRTPPPLPLPAPPRPTPPHPGRPVRKNPIPHSFLGTFGPVCASSVQCVDLIAFERAPQQVTATPGQGRTHFRPVRNHGLFHSLGIRGVGAVHADSGAAGRAALACPGTCGCGSRRCRWLDPMQCVLSARVAMLRAKGLWKTHFYIQHNDLESWPSPTAKIFVSFPEVGESCVQQPPVHPHPVLF
jgi:hypothetical protein